MTATKWPDDHETPFRSRLVLSEHTRSRNDRLRVPIDARSIIVRLVPQPLSRHAHLATAKALLEELETEYGIAIPHRVYLVSERSDGTPQAYILTQVVEGAAVAKALASGDPRVHLFVDETCLSLIRYFVDRYERGGRFLSDVQFEQFLFGRVPNRPEPVLYLVDLDPGFVSIEARTQDPLELARYQWRIANVVNFVVEAEKHSALDLAKARAGLKGALQRLPWNLESARGRREALLSALQQGRVFDGGVWVQEVLEQHERGP